MISQSLYRWFNKLALIDWRRLCNFVKIAVAHWHAQISGKISLQLPYALSLELASVCNLKCPQCPVGLGLIKRDRAFIDVSLATKLIDEFAPHGFVLNLYFQGESLLHKDFGIITTHAANKRLFTILSTNAHFLNQETALSIVSSGLHRVIISIDGYNQNSYERYRSGGDVELAWRGLQLLVDARMKLHSGWPEILVQTVVNRYNEDDLGRIRSKAKGMGADKVVFKTMQIYDNHSNWAPRNAKYSRYRSGQLIKEPAKKCFRAFSSMVVTSDGLFVPCCFDKFGNHGFGRSDLRSMAFSDVRRAFLRKIYHDGAMHNICTNCPEATHVYKKS